MKELADLSYVVDGTVLAYGLIAPEYDIVQQIVHDSNMSKLGLDGLPIRDAGGKVLKGPNYQPADEALIKMFGKRG